MQKLHSNAYSLINTTLRLLGLVKFDEFFKSHLFYNDHQQYLLQLAPDLLLLNL